MHELGLLVDLRSQLARQLPFGLEIVRGQHPILELRLLVLLLEGLRVEEWLLLRHGVGVEPVHFVNSLSNVGAQLEPVLLPGAEVLDPDQPSPVLILEGLEHGLLQLLHLVLVDQQRLSLRAIFMALFVLAGAAGTPKAGPDLRQLIEHCP